MFIRVQLIFALLLLSSASGSPAQVSQAASATPVRQADAACARCHRQIFDSYLKTPMANASGAASDRMLPGSYHDSSSNVDYRFYTAPDGEWMSYDRPPDHATDAAPRPALDGKYKLQYFLGSGHLGLTYLYSIHGYWFETPAAYYAKTGYDMKPGIGHPPNMPPGLPMNSGCMRCHMSDVPREDAGTDNHYQGLPFRHGGITCESCHGDATRHLATQGKASVINPVKLDPDRRDSICINCHLEGDTNVEHRGRYAVDYKPGERISDYLAFYQYVSADATSRGVSEIEQFSQSRCKRTSGDRMSCTTCHDPHRTPDPQERVAFYRGKCLQCHNVGNFAATHHTENPDCTSCHMPKSGAGNIPHVAWTDHRLLARPDQAHNSNRPTGSRDLVPILKAGGTPRDLALAYYNLVTNGERAERQRAFELLAQANQADPSDTQVAMALGVLFQAKGARPEAIAAYKQVLHYDPLNLTASVNLGTLLAQSGDLAGADTLWQKAFAHNEDNATLGINLAIVECMLAKKPEAENTLTGVLVYSPDEPRARQKLDAIASGRDKCGAPSKPELTNPE
jgi:hypothetical protein